MMEAVNLSSSSSDDDSDATRLVELECKKPEVVINEEDDSRESCESMEPTIAVDGHDSHHCGYVFAADLAEDSGKKRASDLRKKVDEDSEEEVVDDADKENEPALKCPRQFF